MRVSVVHPGELGPDDIASWRVMQSSTPSLASPFLSPEFTIAVGEFRPSARVAVLSEGPDVVGFFPFGTVKGHPVLYRAGGWLRSKYRLARSGH